MSDNLIQSGALQRRLADALNLKEKSPAPTLAPEIQAVILVDDLTRPDRSETVRVCSGGVQRVGVAGQVSQVVLINPATSSILVTVDQVIIAHEDGAAGHSFQLGLGAESSWTVIASTSQQVLNSRNPTTERSTALIDANTLGVPSILPVIVRPFVPAFTLPFVYQSEGLILAPGSLLLVGCLQNAIAIDISFVWREEHLAR